MVILISPADSWPQKFDYSGASQDWGYQPLYDFRAMCSLMVEQLWQVYKPDQKFLELKE